MGSALSCQFSLLPSTLTVPGLPQKLLQHQQAPDYGFGEQVSSQHTLQLVSIYFPPHWLPFGRADNQAPCVGVLSYPVAAHNQCGCTLGSKVFLNCYRSILHGKGSKIGREASPGKQGRNVQQNCAGFCQYHCKISLFGLVFSGIQNMWMIEISLTKCLLSFHVLFVL